MRVLPATLLAAAVLVAACDRPVPESFPPDGNAPAPRGIIEGTILYAGPRPSCVTDASGAPVRAFGRVVLTLFRYDDPPPPSGSASSAENLLALPADVLFQDVADCRESAPNDPEPIVRSASFTWPDQVLGRDYQIRGFFDADEDFNPFYSVRNLPTRGDVAGGAFEDPTAAVPVYRRIAFDTPEVRSEGQVVSGVSVSLGAPVDTERPMFRLDPGTKPLDGEATLPTDTNPILREQKLWELTQTRLDLVPPDDADWTPALQAAGIAFDFDPAGYAFFVAPVDADGDGVQDLHPILGSAGIKWTTPIYILERGRTALEQEAGVPRVLLIGTTRPSQTLMKKVFAPSIDMVVAPVAVVDLNPADPDCKIPYVPPGNVAGTYEAKPVECQEVPSGWYGMSVLQGIAGGVLRDGATAATSDTGFVVDGGAFSGQAWSIPNELGPPDPSHGPITVGQLDPGLLIPSQGARYRVYDGNPTDGVRHDCASAPDEENGGVRRPVVYQPIPEDCCAPVRRLCGLPLCAASQGIREAAAATDGGLACVPFLVPESCCE